MLWTIIRTIGYILLAIGVWLGVQFYIAKNLEEQMYTAPSEALFVDRSVTGNSYYESLYDSRFSETQKFLLKKFSPIEQIYNGTPLFPFATITDALAKMDETGIRMIKISNGVYEETLKIPENTMLIGSGETVIYTNPTSLEDAVTTSNNTAFVNLTISGGKHAVFIPHGTSALFDRVTISDANDFGVKMGSKDRPEVPDGEDEPVIYEYYGKTESEIAAMPLVKFTNCTITKNDNQGMYLRDGRVEIHDSYVIENGEEGIDLHPHMHVIISHTESSRNGESGLESEIYDNTVLIKDNQFEQNIKNGIGLITSHGVGSFTIEGNDIIDNARYGIRCAIHKNKPKEPRPFFQSVVNETDNYFEGNEEGRYSDPCLNF